jgi:hypothetical protein
VIQATWSSGSGASSGITFEACVFSVRLENDKHSAFDIKSKLHVPTSIVWSDCVFLFDPSYVVASAAVKAIMDFDNINSTFTACLFDAPANISMITH